MTCLQGLEASKPRSRTAEINFSFMSTIDGGLWPKLYFLMKWKMMNIFMFKFIRNINITINWQCNNYIFNKFELKYIQFFSFHQKKFNFDLRPLSYTIVDMKPKLISAVRLRGFKALRPHRQVVFLDKPLKPKLLFVI